MFNNGQTLLHIPSWCVLAFLPSDEGKSRIHTLWQLHRHPVWPDCVGFDEVNQIVDFHTTRLDHLSEDETLQKQSARSSPRAEGVSPIAYLFLARK